MILKNDKILYNPVCGKSIQSERNERGFHIVSNIKYD